jgi:hypothetical protein
MINYFYNIILIIHIFFIFNNIFIIFINILFIFIIIFHFFYLIFMIIIHDLFLLILLIILLFSIIYYSIILYLYTHFIYSLYFYPSHQLNPPIISIVPDTPPSLFDTPHTLFESPSNYCYYLLIFLFFAPIVIPLFHTYFFFIYYVDYIAPSPPLIIFLFDAMTPLTPVFCLPLLLAFISIPLSGITFNFHYQISCLYYYCYYYYYYY